VGLVRWVQVGIGVSRVAFCGSVQLREVIALGNIRAVGWNGCGGSYAGFRSMRAVWLIRL